MKLATGHPFDDEHGTGANRTAQLGSDVRMSCATFYAKQSTAACEHTATPAVGEKAEVADADQALGENVDQESAEELICGDRHDLLLAVRIVFPAKRDSIILERNQSMVGDGDAVRIASEIVQNMLGTAEGWFGIDHPVLAKELSEKLAKATWLSKAVELELVLLKELLESGCELAAEDATQRGGSVPKCGARQETRCLLPDASGRRPVRAASLHWLGTADRKAVAYSAGLERRVRAAA
jgi:hypothetical protein